MQRSKGYCSYCRVTYNNLEQHLFSAQHRSVTRQSRQRLINNNSLMERFLQDVLRHHPSNYQDSSAQQEAPEHAASPEVIRLDEFSPEDREAEEKSSKSSESAEESRARPGASQSSAKEVYVRPSVIQKLERGQQQPLELNKIESGVRKINLVDIGQPSNNGQSVIRPPVICNAPASCAPGNSYARPVSESARALAESTRPVAESARPVAVTTRPVGTSASRIPIRLRSVSKRNPSKVDKTKQLDEGPTHHTLSCHPEIASVSHENPKESNKKSVRVNLNNKKDVKCQGQILSPASKFHEQKDTKSSVRVESSSKVTGNPVVKLNKPTVLPAKRISEGAIPKRRGKFPSQMGCTREEKLTVHNKPAVSKQKSSVITKVKCNRSSLQSASVPAGKAVQEYRWEEEQGGSEDGNYGSQGSEMSFDDDLFSPSPTDLSEVTAGKTNVSENTHTAVQYKSNKACDSKVNLEGECDDSLQVVANKSQVIVKEKSPPKAARISLVDESYDSSGSEMNFDCEDSAEPTDINPKQRNIDVIFPNGICTDLVDKSYGSGSSRGSAASVASHVSVVKETPVHVTEKKRHMKPHVCLVDKSYGSSYSESNSDSDGLPQAAGNHPQMTVTEGNQKGRPVQLKTKKCKPSSTKAHLACGASLEAVSPQPQRDAGRKKLLKKKNAGLVEMNCESHDPDMVFHADAQLVADESQVAVEVNAKTVDIDLENKSVQSSISDLSFESYDCLYQSANDELEGDLGEVNLKELNEAKSGGCSISELTFDSDSPLLSVTERSQLDVERLKEDLFNLEEESSESNSSGLTFDSDISTCSVVDQPQVAVFEEEPVDLENENDDSYVSEISFDSDIPLHSGNDQPEVAVKEVIIQEEEYIPLERKNAKPSGSEINLDSHTPLHSVTNPPKVAIKNLSSQILKHKENKPTDSELNMNHDTFHSTTGHFEDLNDSNFQKEECVHLENELDRASVSGTQLDSGASLPSTSDKPQVVVKNMWLQKEKQADFQGKSAESGVSEIKPNVPHPPAKEPQVSLKRKEKKKHIEKKVDQYDDSDLTWNCDDFLWSMPESPPPLTALQQGIIYLEDESPQNRVFEADVDIINSLHAVPDQTHLIFLEKKSADGKDKSHEPSDSKMSFSSVDCFQLLPEQYQKIINQINKWREEAAILKSRADAPSCSKAVHGFDVSLEFTSRPHTIAIQLVSVGEGGRVCLDSKGRIFSEMQLDSDLLLQAIIDQPYIAVNNSKKECEIDLCYSEGSCAFAASCQPEANQLRETERETSGQEIVDLKVERGADESTEIVHDSDILQPETSQTKVNQEVKLQEKYLDSEDKDAEPSSQINSDSNEPSQETITEAHHLGNGHVFLKGYEPDGSKLTYISSLPLDPLIQQQQNLEEEHANLEMDSCDPHPSASYDSNKPGQSVSGQLQKTDQEMSLKEGCIYPEDKNYKLVSFEGGYNSDVPVQFVIDPYVSDKEINVQADHNDLENQSYKAYCCEIDDSAIHLQSEVNVLEMVSNETSFQNKGLSDMEEKANEPSDFDMMHDSNVIFEIVVNSSQSSDGEADTSDIVFVREIASESECDREVISDPDVPLQLTPDPSQLTGCMNEESIQVGKHYCHFCGSELKYEAAYLSVTNQSSDTFTIINQKNDYIVLGELICQSCGQGPNFNITASDPSVFYQSQWTGQGFEGTSENTDSEVSLWKDPNSIGLNGMSLASSSASAVDYAESVIYLTADQERSLKLQGADLASSGDTSYSSQVDFQYNLLIQADAKQPQKAFKRKYPQRNVSFDKKEYHFYPNKSLFMIVHANNMNEGPVVIEDDTTKSELEALPPVSQGPQKIKDDDSESEPPMKRLRNGRCYGCPQNTIQKVLLVEETKPTPSNANQNTVSVETVSDSNYDAEEAEDDDDISIISHNLDCDCYLAVEFLKKNPQDSPVYSLSTHSTQTKCMKCALKKRKMAAEAEVSPKRQCLESDAKNEDDQVEIVEIPTSSTNTLELGEPSSTASAPPSSGTKRKKRASSSSPRKRKKTCAKQPRSVGKRRRYNRKKAPPKKAGGKPPKNPVIPGSGTSKSADTQNGRDGSSSARGNSTSTQVPDRKAFIATATYSLKQCGNNETCVVLESMENLNLCEAAKVSNFQLSPSNSGAKASRKSVTKKNYKSKSRKTPKKKKTTNVKESAPQSICKTEGLEEDQETEESVLLRTKANSIIKKYTLRYCIFLSPRYQSKTTFSAVNSKKKIPNGTGQKKKLKNSPVPPTRVKNQPRAIAGSSRKQLVLRSSRTSGRNKLVDKTYTYKQKIPILRREYNLRSSHCSPNGSRMMTRLSSKYT
ncbi:DBF4-type zinc finger-containing protein 2 [Octodon degus]|uniref:DBF4-type zinc finger-containing protein 2 n=1 Tax=Octodon degus TaxID=10160 RepID=A0A6P3EL16_OCTDE|nr:DBF4-type zinc finger-containing protein 2 [Octodon degus]